MYIHVYTFYDMLILSIYVNIIYNMYIGNCCVSAAGYHAVCTRWSIYIGCVTTRIMYKDVSMWRWLLWMMTL